MLEDRDDAASAQFGSTGFWWVTGGETISTELYDDTTRQFYSYVDLPKTMSYHNMVNINDTHTVILGGAYTSGDIFIFSRETLEFESLPSIPTPRRMCQAGLIYYPNGNKGILVAGGEDEISTEFLDLDTLTWSAKEDLPIDVHLGASVPYQNGLLIAGGWIASSSVATNNMIFFDPELDSWQVLTVTMNGSRNSFPAFIVPDAYANCFNFDK